MYNELFGGSVGLARRQAANHPLEFSTPLYVEWDTAKSLGMTVEQYQKSVSRRERRIQYYGRILASEKERHQYDKMKEEREMESRKTESVYSTTGRR